MEFKVGDKVWVIRNVTDNVKARGVTGVVLSVGHNDKYFKYLVKCDTKPLPLHLWCEVTAYTKLHKLLNETYTEEL